MIEQEEAYPSGKLWIDVFLTGPVSADIHDSEVKNPSTIGEINDDSSGSAATLDNEEEDTTHEDPPNRLWKFPSGNSLLNIDNVECDPPLLDFLLRCMYYLVKACYNTT